MAYLAYKRNQVERFYAKPGGVAFWYNWATFLLAFALTIMFCYTGRSEKHRTRALARH